MNMLRKWSAITLACVIAASMVLLAGCAEKSDQSQSEYADEAFIQSLAKGYEARDTLVGQSSKAEKSAEYYEKLVDAELEQVDTKARSFPIASCRRMPSPTSTR